MIKDRIIQLIEYKRIPKEEFYVKIGMTSASFRGKARMTPLNSNAIENLLTIIPDVNALWLLTGKGNMLIDNSAKAPETAETITSDSPNFIKRFEELAVENALLKRELQDIKSERGSVPRGNTIPVNEEEISLALKK